MKAKAAAQERPISELIAEFKSFINRSEKRLAKLEEERVAENVLLEEGRARLAMLESQAAVSAPLPSAIPLAELEAEVSRLLAELADARGVSGASSGIPPPKKRLQEDFVLITVE